MKNKVETKRMRRKIDVRFWFVALFSLLILVIYKFYPGETNNLFQGIVTSVILMVILPTLFIKIILKDSLKEYGFNIPLNWKSVLIFCVMLILAVVLFAGMFKLTPLHYKYGLNVVDVSRSFKLFLISEVVTAFSLLIIVEIFFRSFIQSFLEQYFVPYKAILLQVIYFFLVIYFWERNNFWEWPVFSLIFIAPFAGWVKWKTDSWIYSWLLVCLFLIISDSIILKLK